ncbi:MAG: biotin transporter BioY [Inquilinus sp.]|nr:biotin transporter BioY [Inquilinus sp.]
MQPTSASLIATLWPAEGVARLARSVLLVVAGTALLTVCAKTQVPFWPVPMTMQTWAVLMIGAAYGWRLGGATVLAYLAEGAAGLPVFAGATAGPAYLAGPTAGYLVGFVLAAALIGWLAERGWDRDLPRLLLGLGMATVVPFVTGVVWLSTIVGIERAIDGGLLPFIPGAVLKLALAAALLTVGWRLVHRLRG